MKEETILKLMYILIAIIIFLIGSMAAIHYVITLTEKSDCCKKNNGTYSDGEGCLIYKSNGEGTSYYEKYSVQTSPSCMLIK